MEKFQNDSPCLRCKRTYSPALCEDKRCGIWRQWFLARWAKTCKLFAPKGESR